MNKNTNRRTSNKIISSAGPLSDMLRLSVLGFVPVVHGDIVLDDEIKCSVCGGDRIVQWLSSDIVQAIREAMASRSRRPPRSSTLTEEDTLWLIITLQITPAKAIELVGHNLVGPGDERNNIKSCRIYGDIDLHKWRYDLGVCRRGPLTEEHWANMQIG